MEGAAVFAAGQLAIGAISQAQGIEGGEIILALSALSILVTAPLGALGDSTLCASAAGTGGGRLYQSRSQYLNDSLACGRE